MDSIERAERWKEQEYANCNASSLVGADAAFAYADAPFENLYRIDKIGNGYVVHERGRMDYAFNTPGALVDYLRLRLLGPKDVEPEEAGLFPEYNQPITWADTKADTVHVREDEHDGA
jgi:hypothetical protein